MIEPRSQASSSGNFPNYRQVPPPQQSHYDPPRSRFEKKPAHNFTLLIERQTNLFEKMSAAGIIHLVGSKPIDTIFQFYRADRMCAYHSNNVGHDI